MKSLIPPLLAALLVAAGGSALCRALGWNPMPPVMITAGAAALVASCAAFVPLLLSRGAAQSTVVQSALLGTVVHLLGCLAGAAVLAFVLRAGDGAVYWVMAFYLATLVGLVLSLVRTINATSAQGPAPTGVAPATKQ